MRKEIVIKPKSDEEKLGEIEKEVREIRAKKSIVELGLQAACKGYAQDPMRVALDDIVVGIKMLGEIDKAVDAARKKHNAWLRVERT